MCSHSCCAGELSWACSSSFLTSLPPFIHPSWGPDQDQASSHDIVSAHNIFAAGISTEKSVGMYLEGAITSCFPACFCIYAESSLFFPLSSLTKWETIHTVFVWIFVCCCTFNLEPDPLLTCSSLIQDCFKLLSMSALFHYIILQFFQFPNCKEKFSMVAN